MTYIFFKLFYLFVRTASGNFQLMARMAWTIFTEIKLEPACQSSKFFSLCWKFFLIFKKYSFRLYINSTQNSYRQYGNINKM